MKEKNIKNTNTQPSPRNRLRRSILVGVLLGLVIAALLLGVYLVYSILNEPSNLFETAEMKTEEATPSLAPAFDVTAYLPVVEEEPETVPLLPQPEPEQETKEAELPPQATLPAEEAEESALSGIVNVALFGIDAKTDGDTTSGSMPHTDANMIVAINFDTCEVSLISIARDVLTTVPGHSGFYKFNGAFNVGGGMDDPHSGLALACRTAEEWLGGVSVPYYYGVDFQALIDIVDALGGIDFDVDIDVYRDNGISRVLHKGMQHLDGRGVLTYMRARKSAGGLDYKRTARQRKMIVALFKKIKEEGQLSQIPDLLKVMEDNVYTNTSLAQTAALANFARNVDPDSIQTYSIYGDMGENYLWRYCFIDQQARLDILKEVYGIDASPMGVDTMRYEKFLYDSGFKAIQHLNITKKLFEEISASYAEASMTEAQKRAYAACWQAYSNLQTQFDLVNEWIQTFYDDSKAMTASEKDQQAKCYKVLTSLEEKLKTAAETMKKAYGLKTETAWNYSVEKWFYPESVINDVYVDFR